MLRNFVQIVRSGATGRKSLGSAPKRCVRRWLDARTDEALFAASVGQAPSLADVIRMVHPKPAHAAARGALRLPDRPPRRRPDRCRRWCSEFEAFKAGDRRRGAGRAVPDADGARPRASRLARRSPARSWQTTRMNLNTFARHGVFEDAEMTELVATGCATATEIARARVLPYQLLAACRAADPAVPGAVRRALRTRWRSRSRTCRRSRPGSCLSRTCRDRCDRRSPASARARRRQCGASTSRPW